VTVGRNGRLDIIDHLPALRVYALSLTKSPAMADDIVQDAVIKGLSNFDKFAPGSNLRAWLFTILRNCFYSELRKFQNEFEDIDGVKAEEIEVLPDHDDRLHLNDTLLALARLSPPLREAVWLVGVMGFSYDEAALVSGVALGTLKSRMNRGRKALVQALRS